MSEVFTLLLENGEAGEDSWLAGSEPPPPLWQLMEAARVAAVRSYGVLNHDPDERLDQVCREAAAAWAVPVACVNFIDADRHWTKACVGAATADYPRFLSFCHHTISEPNGTLVVSDLGADVRFSAHPLVISEPRYRFYAGASVVDAGGYRVGTVCVLDTATNRTRAEGLATLQRLSFTVAKVLASGPIVDLPANAGPDADGTNGPLLVQGWLGVRTEHAAGAPGNDRCGLLLLSVAYSSPAERAGLEVGDVLVSIANRPILALTDISHALSNRLSGEALPVQVWRSGRALQRTIHIEAMPAGRRTRRKL